MCSTFYHNLFSAGRLVLAPQHTKPPFTYFYSLVQQQYSSLSWLDNIHGRSACSSLHNNREGWLIALVGESPNLFVGLNIILQGQRAIVVESTCICLCKALAHCCTHMQHSANCALISQGVNQNQSTCGEVLPHPRLKFVPFRTKSRVKSVIRPPSDRCMIFAYFACPVTRSSSKRTRWTGPYDVE